MVAKFLVHRELYSCAWPLIGVFMGALNIDGNINKLYSREEADEQTSSGYHCHAGGTKLISEWLSRVVQVVPS